jgi:8-oxo-dGTP pyrophosphatase MutT (NUDIX family)
MTAPAPLAHTTDPFGGVAIAPESLPETPEIFAVAIDAALTEWRSAGLRLAWLKLPPAQMALAPAAIAAGFECHHARAEYLMLVQRLKAGTFIPSDASHFIGAGAVVINDARELLVIVERYHAANRKPFYKMPGGLIDPGEHLADGVMREVLEETGVRTRFESVVCFRHQHGYRFGKSDFYFVCRLSPLSTEIQADPEEIADARWMPVDDYLGNPEVHVFNKHIVRSALDARGANHTIVDGYTVDAKLCEIYTMA